MYLYSIRNLVYHVEKYQIEVRVNHFMKTHVEIRNVLNINVSSILSLS